MAKPAVRASSPRAAMKALKPPPVPPKKPLPVLGAAGVEPGPGVFSPRTLVVFEGVAVGVFAGFSTVFVGVAVGTEVVGVAVGTAVVGVGVGVVIVSGGLQVLVTVQLGGGGVQPSGFWQPLLTVLTLRKLA